VRILGFILYTTFADCIFYYDCCQKKGIIVVRLAAPRQLFLTFFRVHNTVEFYSAMDYDDADPDAERIGNNHARNGRHEYIERF
jgi:hypothetical protein